MRENILVRGVNWIGDAVMTMPALRSLRRAYPDARISLLVRPSVAPLFEKDPLIDDIIVYEDAFRTFFGRIRLSYVLRKRRFSKAILLQNAFDAAMIAYLAGIPERLGYNRDGRGFLLTRRVPHRGDDRSMHHIDYYLNLLRAAGIPANHSGSNSSFDKGGISPWIYLSLEERLSARTALSGLKRPVLGINPGAAYGSAKRWIPERFAEVATWFIGDTGGSVVIFGSEMETGIAEEIRKAILLRQKDDSSLSPSLRGGQREIDHQVLDLAGKTSLRELVSLISECDVFITNDSGPMHIAYAVGAPLAAIFGSTDPLLTGPAGDGSVVMKTDLSCSPCFERTCRHNDMRCMYALSSEDVYHGIADLVPVRRAVFFDRDGTLCRDAGYLNSWSDFEVFREIESLKELKGQGFSLIGVSNQSGIAKGLVDESFVKDVNRVFVEKYGFDDFYYCPHGPDEHCPCRKPEPGMLLRARTDHRIDLKGSYVVGDKEADLLLAKAVGAKAILVTTGEAKGSEHADHTARNLREAADFVIRESER